MIEFLNNTTDFQGLPITNLDFILIGLTLMLTLIINLVIGRFVRKSRLFANLELKRKRLIFNVLSFLLWVAGIAIVLSILGIDLKNFWNFYLVGDDTTKTTFDLQPKHIISAIFVIVFTRIILTALERVFSNLNQFKADDKGRSQAVFKFLSYFLWLFAFLFILNSTGIKLTVIWGAGAALLVGIGFGLQQIFADIISGIFLLFEGNLREGDVVELNSGVVGQVDHVGIRTSKILTRDDYIMIIPNSQFITEEVINWTHNEDNTRFHVSVGVAYGSDTRLVEQVLLACANKHKGISSTPKPFVRFDNFGDSSLDFQIFFWSRNTFRIENLKSDLRFLIDENFREAKIQIPFPQRDVHIKSK